MKIDWEIIVVFVLICAAMIGGILMERDLHKDDIDKIKDLKKELIEEI